MMKKAAVVVLALGIVGHVGAKERDSLARFQGGIGVSPVSSFAGPMNADGTFPNVTRNVVRGVRSSSNIWRIADLRAARRWQQHRAKRQPERHRDINL
jgi:hypothetical protein